jgi:hypothetical protein
MNRQIFKDEKDMQQWLSKELRSKECLSELIFNMDEFENYEATNLGDRKVFEAFKNCTKSLNVVTIIAENENISFDDKDSLKPDFVLYAPETESVIIVELKNIVTPSRQTGTEISAYANEVKTYIPFISDGDIVNIIVSSVWPTLLRHYTFHEIFWQQRNILCLQPIEVNEEIKLEIVDVKSIAADLISLKLSVEHLGGYHICLYDDHLNTNERNRQRLDQYVEQMKTAMTAMASKGNSQKTHGFAFLWKDNFELSGAPYNITLINFAPFQSFERHFHNNDFVPNKIAKGFIEIIKEHDPIGHGMSLDAITSQGQLFLNNFCSPKPEVFEKWGILRETMDDRCEQLISFRCWGVFEEIYSDKLLQLYKDGNTQIKYDDPFLGMELVNELIDPDYPFYNLSYFDEEQEDSDEL